MTKIYLPTLFALSMLLAFSNCKKKSSANPTPVVDTPFIYGEMTASRQDEQDTLGAGYLIVEYAFANFWSDSITKATVSPGIVSVNGDTLAMPNSENFHSFNFADSVYWNIGGGMFVPAFSCSLAGNFPGYTGTSLPDTIDAALGMTLNITAATTNNADSIGFAFAPYHGDSSYKFIYRTNPGQVHVTLPNLSPSNYGVGQLFVSAFKTDYYVINGRKYQFIRRRAIVKFVYLH